MRSRLVVKANSFGAKLGAAIAMLGIALSCTAALAQDAPPPDFNQPGTDFVADRVIAPETPIKVIIITPVGSDSSQYGDLVKVRIAPDDSSGLPHSIVFVGHVRDAIPATNHQPGELVLRFDGLAPNGRWQPGSNGSTTPVEEASARFVGGDSASGGKNDVGIGAAAGAVIGGSRKLKLGDAIEGGILGALGGYAVQKATTHPASDIDLKNGQEVTITLKHPIEIKTELIAS